MTVFRGVRAIVTAGPTYEPLDPVRFIGNYSSGKQGYAIARALADAGMQVTLISGPVHLEAPRGVVLERVETAREMLAACKAHLPADIFIAAAAVADWRPKKAARTKMKKNGQLPPTIALIENPDIVKTIAALKERPRLVIGFAAETGNLLTLAEQKRRHKKLDWILANDVSQGAIFNADTTSVVWMSNNRRETWTGTKDDIATRLVRKITSLW